MIEQVENLIKSSNKNSENRTPNDTIYLCNFRVSVDGEWLCLKELQELGNNFPPTPELEKITFYPNYPVGPKERDPILIERSNLINISKLVIKEVIESSFKFNRQLDSDHIPLQHFFIVLEHVLRHGIKPKKGLLGPRKELWDLLQNIELLDTDAQDITASVRDLPTVKTTIGRMRAWLRLALMQKKLAEYFRILVSQKKLLAEYYSPTALIRSDEANLITALLDSLNVVDCNLCVKEEDLDSQQGVIDFSLYLRSKKENNDEDLLTGTSNKNSMPLDSINTVLNQKNYIEELNRHLNATVGNLQEKVEYLTTENALMKEDVAFTNDSIEKVQIENKRLKAELEHYRNIDRLSQEEMPVKKSMSVVQSSYESGMKELSTEFRVRLQQEITRREESEELIAKQEISQKELMCSLQSLEKENKEKQDIIESLKGQLEDIKCINLEMYTKLAECEYEISQKGELVAKLEAKTKEISTILTNLNDVTQCNNC